MNSSWTTGRMLGCWNLGCNSSAASPPSGAAPVLNLHIHPATLCGSFCSTSCLRCGVILGRLEVTCNFPDPACKRHVEQIHHMTYPGWCRKMGSSLKVRVRKDLKAYVMYVWPQLPVFPASEVLLSLRMCPLHGWGNCPFFPISQSGCVVLF